jgi:L-ascorbate metabolism protein UlaG (beta-lactamase superfamily)
MKAEFGSEGARTLCAARGQPVDLRVLSDLLGCPIERLAGYFVAENAVAKSFPYTGEGVRVRYFGHACLLIETSEVSILVDPTAARDRQPGAEHFTFDDLPPRIDFLFISHGHQDHCCPEMLMQLRERVGVVLIPPNNRGEPSDPSLRRILARLKFQTIVTLDGLESMAVNGGSITALPFTGEHGDLDVHSKQCAFFELKGRRICLLVDTDAIDVDVYRRIAPRISQPDLIFIGMECLGAPLSWLYGPLISGSISKRNDNSRRLSGANCDRAWRIVETLNPRQVCVYAMGQEPWMRNLMGLNYAEDSIQLEESKTFVQRCAAEKIPAQILYRCMETLI